MPSLYFVTECTHLKLHAGRSSRCKAQKDSKSNQRKPIVPSQLQNFGGITFRRSLARYLDHAEIQLHLTQCNSKSQLLSLVNKSTLPAKNVRYEAGTV